MIEPTPEEARARNARVTQALVAASAGFGLSAVTEFPIRGGRIDVVWLWRPPTAIPGAEPELPIVGFEIESSWRTRKHIKGDLVNLQDLRPLLGVIVLLGDGADVESTRRFASGLVDRPGTRVVVWSEDDVEALLAGEVSEDEGKPIESWAPAPSGDEHWGKYRPLWLWLRSQAGSSVTVTFPEVEEVLGFPLPPSSRRHLPHWYGYSASAVGRAIRDAGWRARDVNLVAQTVTFEQSET